VGLAGALSISRCSRYAALIAAFGFFSWARLPARQGEYRGAIRICRPPLEHPLGLSVLGSISDATMLVGGLGDRPALASTRCSKARARPAREGRVSAARSLIAARHETRRCRDVA